MKRAWAAGVVMLVSLSVFAQPKTWDLDALVDAAIKRSPLVRAARFSTKAMEARLLKARSAAWPRGSVTGLIAPTPAVRGNAVNGHTDLSEWGYFVYAKIEGMVPIYTFGKISSLKTAAKYGVRVGKYRQAIARSQVALQVQSVYYAAVAANAVLHALNDGRKYIKRAEKKLHELEQEDDPDFDPVDKMKFRVFKNQYFIQRARAASAVDQAISVLSVLTGVKGLKIPSELSPLDWKEKNPDDYIRQALHNRPELLALDAAVHAKEAEVGFRKSAFYPDLFIAGRFQIGHSNVADPQDSPFAYDPFNTYSAAGTLGLKMDLNIGGKIADLDLAKAELDEIAAKRDAAKQGVRAEVMRVLRELREARELVKYARAELKAAESWAVAQSDLYDNGFCSIKDLTDGVVQYYKAKFDYYQAVGQFNIRMMKLLNVTGQPWRKK